MIKNTTLFSRARMVTSSPAKRALLFVGGATVGSFLAAGGSYGVVSLLYPRQAAPVVIAAPQALPPLATEQALQASALDTANQDVAAPEQPPVILAPIEQPTDTLPSPAADLVVATKSEPTITLPESEPAEVIASVASQELAEPSAPIAHMATPFAAPDMPRIRPAARPDDLTRFTSLTENPETIPMLRPHERPEGLQLAAAETRMTGRASAAGSLCGAPLARAIPSRPSGAPTGSDFFAALGGLSGAERDQRVIDELARGNAPSFLRDLQPVTFRGEDARGADTEIVICVTPDYLALGSDRDYVRVPLGLPAAARIAGQFDMTLPTPRMVDAIYSQADVQLAPSPMQPGPQMSSTSYFLRHNDTIEGQLHGRGGLVAGQKKDVVMASRMANAPGRVAIYGWHRSASSPIQPVSTVHGKNYADYSHGIRLVSKTAYLNGRAVNLDELLESGRYAYLLNKEGPLPGPVIRTASR